MAHLQILPSYPPRVQECVRGVARARAPPQGQHPAQQPSYVLFPGIEAKGWWEREEFPDLVEKLETAFPKIKEECLALIKIMEDAGEGWPPQKPQKPQEQQEEKGGSCGCGEKKEECEGEKEEDTSKPKDPFVRPSYIGHKWGCYWLWKDGKKIESHCKVCPTTAAVVESLKPALMDEFCQGHVYFSILEPGAWIRPHFGPANLRLRIHMGMIVPPKDCNIRVVDEWRTWEEGKCIIFDDSFEHEIKHEGEGYRVVLIVDIWHPGLSAEEIAALKYWFQLLES